MENQNTRPSTCAETALRVFAIINSIFTGAACACGYILLIVQLIYMFDKHLQNYIERNILLDIFTGILVFAIVFFTTAFIFSIILSIGLFKKKPSYVKAYFIYGVVILILSLIGLTTGVALFLFYNVFELYVTIIIGTSFLAVCIFYGVVLLTLWTIFKKYQEETQYAPVKLKDNKC